MTETKEQREARFAVESAYCAEQIAKIEEEYKAKGYDKIMPMDELEELILRTFGPVIDALAGEDAPSSSPEESLPSNLTSEGH